MKKNTLVKAVLPTLLFSTAILTSSAYADELGTNLTNADASVVQASAADTAVETLIDVPAGTVSSDGPAEAAGSELSADTASEVADAPLAELVADTALETGTEDITGSETAATPVEESTEAADSLTILHTNDVHGRMVADSSVIGLASLASVVEAERQAGKTVLLDAGDAFQGLPISNSSKGEDMAAILNAIGYDAMTLGNHEFDFGLDQLRKLNELLTFPLISSNVYVDGARLFNASTIIDKDKNLVGDELVVIGVTTPETATKTHPNNVKDVSFTDPVTEVETVIAQIEAQARAEGTTYNTYVILAHLGVDSTTPTEWQGAYLAEKLSENALLADKKVIVIDGHSHTVMSATYGNVTYNQTGSYLNNIGRIKLNSSEVLSAGVITKADVADLEEDASVAELVKAIQTKYEEENSLVLIENNPVELNGQRSNVRVRETNLGNAVADALLEYGQTGFTNKSNLAVTNGGGLRETLAKGEAVTKGDIIAVLPFGNIISQIEVTGQQLLDMFQVSLGSVLQADEDGNPVLDENGQPLLEASGGFLQVAGARIYYDTTLEAAERILYIEIWNPETDDYSPLDLSAIYYLATNDFLAAGGDAYTMLGGAREEGPSLDEVFAAYLIANQDKLNQYEVINPNSRTISISASLDTDGDGFADYIEMIVGTSVTDSNDYPGKEEAPDADGDLVKPAEDADKKVAATVKKTTVHSTNTNDKIAVAVSYKTAKYDQLPATSDQESILTVLLGISLAGYGFYNLRRRSYRK